MSTSSIGLMYQLESKADAKDTSDYERSLLYMILTLVGHIEDYSDQVAAIGQEANAFSNIKSDITNVSKDIDKLKSWRVNHPTATVDDAMKDPDYKAAVEAFRADTQKYFNDTNHPNTTDPKAPNYIDPKVWEKCKQDGMAPAINNATDMYNTTFTLPDGSQASLNSLLNDPAYASHLGEALFSSAMHPETAEFSRWKDGSTGLDNNGMQFGTLINNFDTDLSTKGNQLQQIDQSGQNVTTATGTLMNVIIQHLAEHA